MPSLTKQQREQVMRELARVMAQLHDVDLESVGLQSYGRPDAYYQRTVARWSDQLNNNIVYSRLCLFK